MRDGRPITFLLALALAGCARPIRTGALIDRYSRADCIPVSFGFGIRPPTRAWDYTLMLRDGTGVHVSGAQMPGGRIDVRYTPDGKEDVAANAGDYIYPADVRFDHEGDRLYVKASGLVVVGGALAFGALTYPMNRWCVAPAIPSRPWIAFHVSALLAALIAAVGIVGAVQFAVWKPYM